LLGTAYLPDALPLVDIEVIDVRTRHEGAGEV
jgi:hypothetical protein